VAREGQDEQPGSHCRRTAAGLVERDQPSACRRRPSASCRTTSGESRR
jgi:hypothetical protein